MSKQRDARNLIAGLDIGSSKITCIVAEVQPEGTLEVIGMGLHPSTGLRRGVVVNIESTVNAIQRALEEAELMADCRIREVYTSIAGNHIRSFNSHGMVAIKNKEISPIDVERAIDTARAVNIPMDQQILHTIPQEFVVDGQEDVKDPLGMSAVRLEVHVHMVTGAVSAVQNIVKCVRRCGIEVRDLVLQPLASALAVLTEDEKELGVALIDIGHGTTDLAVFTKGAIRHTAMIPVAGEQVTNDIAVALRTPPKEAENLKIRHGCASRQLADARDMIEVPGLGDRPAKALTSQVLAGFIEPRIEELYSMVQAELRRSGFEELLSSGIVITGGSAAMPGMIELGEEVLHMPVRLGYPRSEGGLSEILRNPSHATGVGLLFAGLENYSRDNPVKLGVGGFKNLLESMKSWFKGNF